MDEVEQETVLFKERTAMLVTDFSKKELKY